MARREERWTVPRTLDLIALQNQLGQNVDHKTDSTKDYSDFLSSFNKLVNLSKENK